VTLLLPLQQSISSTFYGQLLRQYYFAKKLQSQTVFREKLLKSTYVQKSCPKSVDEIDTWARFHQQVYAQLLHK